jgi:transposase InsO family protein
MCCGTHQQLRTALQGLGLSGRLNTAFVERINLTLRQSIAALVRRTWSTAQDLPQLLVYIEWWRAYYHFVRPVMCKNLVKQCINPKAVVDIGK